MSGEIRNADGTIDESWLNTPVEADFEVVEPTLEEIKSYDVLGNPITTQSMEDNLEDIGVVGVNDDFDSMMTGELREVMLEAFRITEILKTAKTHTKKDFYKKKIAKLQKKAKILLYSQYLKGRNLPQESTQEIEE